MGAIANLVDEFVATVKEGRTEIYNEFNLQHELGVFLRGKLPNYKIQFERNVAYFFPSKPSFTKREIDLSVFLADRSELKYAIELKYPRNGQYPEQMFNFCKDVAFAEELTAAGFSAAGLAVFVDDQLFYGGSTKGIYDYFRGGKPLHGRIQKPTGRQDYDVLVRGCYPIRWKPISGPLVYAVVEAA
jgi:hypothetical protein